MPPKTDERSAKAQEFWARNLDPQNLERSGAGDAELSAEREAQFAWTPDTEAAWQWLSPRSGWSSSGPGGAPGPARIVDLGAGLGAMSFAFAGRGADIIAVDTSIERLAKLKGRAEEVGCSDRITPVVASAEALPFREGSIRGLYTKSVLIHTDIPRASAEIGRILEPGGRAALAEPQPANPFAWLYRNTLAPAEWKSITTYFGGEEQRTTIVSIGAGRVRPFYLFGFLAFAFQFAWPSPKLFRFALGITQILDGILLAGPTPLRRLAWFGLIEAEKPMPSTQDPASKDAL